MFKSLRRKRLTLFKNARFHSYVKYAIGEIILVMLGILLALQVNNWNNLRTNSNKEKIYLNNLSLDLEHQLVTLDKHIYFEKMVFENSKKILAHYDQNDGFKNLTPIFTYLNDLVTRYTYIDKNTTFKELSSSGNLQLIKDEDLRKNLIEYYQEQDRLAALTQNNNNNIIDGITAPDVFRNSLYNRTYLSGSLKDLLSVDSLDFQMSASSKKRLMEYSEARLSDPDVELEFFNMINFRMIVAKFHWNNFLKSKESTLELLKKMK